MCFYPSGSKEPQIAVVVATNNRTPQLFTRSLPSVKEQTRSPDFLVVVDDSTPEVRGENNRQLSAFVIQNTQIIYLENMRTPGASGAWNTAFDYLFRSSDNKDNLYVAILDDDDAWAPEYLDRCSKQAISENLDMVAADINRYEHENTAPIFNAAPERLKESDFLIGNPGIQGSNLFVRLNILFEAGLFDEHLTSCTDRDLCIRICELGDIRFKRVPESLVLHYAEPDRNRLSKRGSKVKHNGLTYFWRKYAGRMSYQQRGEFCARAESLFDWKPPRVPSIQVSEPEVDNPRKAIVLGLIADNNQPDNFLTTVERITQFRDDYLVGLEVVLLEQGPRSSDESLLNLAATRIRDASLGCFCFPFEHQILVARENSPDDQNGEQQRKKPIPLSDLLQFLCGEIANSRKGTEAWALTTCLIQDNKKVSGKLSKIEKWLYELGAIKLTKDHSAMPTSYTEVGLAHSLSEWMSSERIATAQHRIKSRFSLVDLKLLGKGSEGVVFTDGNTVFKCIDYWKTRMPLSQLEFLKRKVRLWKDMEGLYPLIDVVFDGPWALLSYPFEESVPYEGGREEQIIQFLIGCAQAGIVCNNVQPKNLIVTKSGVKLIDYGSDIRPWSHLGFEHMLRRAFLSISQASAPNLKELMRQALEDHSLPELEGYGVFREKVNRALPCESISKVHGLEGVSNSPYLSPFTLYIGVISSDSSMLHAFLKALKVVERAPCIACLKILVLDNVGIVELRNVIAKMRTQLNVTIVSLEKQKEDARRGVFGSVYRHRPNGQVCISQARTMLQRYLGSLLEEEAGAIGWILDDDMRIDERALEYLPWLPAFREEGVDVLLGHYEGASPNPPLNGLRVQLVDILHNYNWLKNLPRNSVLPERSEENEELRKIHPDYYYDLSRKHSGHLETPHWIEPVYEGETVGEASSRLQTEAILTLSGYPLTRSITTDLPQYPLELARDSVNRGGITFILNHRALTMTPNLAPKLRGMEARRSDMLWAIVNRHYRGMTIKSVGFPVRHLARVTEEPHFDIDKVAEEILGSAFYAGLQGILRDSSSHRLQFSSAEQERLSCCINENLSHRLTKLEQSFYRLRGLQKALKRVSENGHFIKLLSELEKTYTLSTYNAISNIVSSYNKKDTTSFIVNLLSRVDDYAERYVELSGLKEELIYLVHSEERAK